MIVQITATPRLVFMGYIYIYIPGSRVDRSSDRRHTRGATMWCTVKSLTHLVDRARGCVGRVSLQTTKRKVAGGGGIALEAGWDPVHERRSFPALFESKSRISWMTTAIYRFFFSSSWMKAAVVLCHAQYP